MAEAPNQAQAELVRRHRSTVLIVRVLLALVVGLVLAAFITRGRISQRENPPLDIAVRITILIFGLGSITLRRSRFSTMRLQDITALRGVSALLSTLEKTTIQVAALGGIIAVFGFIATLMTGNDFYAYGAGLVGIVVLLYCYPTKNSWQQTVKKFATTEGGGPPPPPLQYPEQ